MESSALNTTQVFQRLIDEPLVPRHKRAPRFLRGKINRYLDDRRGGILHIGAHDAADARFYGDRPVLWLEANPELMPALLRNIEHFPRQKAFCALIGDRRRGSDFNISSNSYSSSVFDFGPYSSGAKSLWPDAGLHMQRTIRLEMQTLDSFWEESGIDPRDYDTWIMDVQGAELLVLSGATESLQFCKVIATEISTVEVYQGGVRYDEIRHVLTSAGFVPLVEPHSLNMQHGDITFVHRSLAKSFYFRMLLLLLSWWQRG